MLRGIFVMAFWGLAGCSADVMTTSGRDYLAKGGSDSADIVARANYEPNLAFPARVGLVRLVYGKLSVMPEKERALLGGDLPDALGQMTFLGPLEADMAGVQTPYRPWGTEEIRAIAASRHLDYVMVLSYQPRANTVETLFLDVRNGYPYASTEVRGAGNGVRSFWGGPVRKQNRLDRATYRLAKDLKPKLDQIAQQLVAAGQK